MISFSFSNRKFTNRITKSRQQVEPPPDRGSSRRGSVDFFKLYIQFTKYVFCGLVSIRIIDFPLKSLNFLRKFLVSIPTRCKPVIEFNTLRIIMRLFDKYNCYYYYYKLCFPPRVIYSGGTRLPADSLDRRIRHCPPLKCAQIE